MKLKTISLTSFFVILGLLLALNVAKAEDGAIRTMQVKEKIENQFEKNRDIRNIKIEERKTIKASTTEKMRELREESKELRASTTEKMRELRDERKEEKKELKEERKDLRASTTAAFKILKNERGEALKKLQLNAYEMRKKALLNELNATINNLVNVRGKILERITMLESKGRDMTKPKADLVIADDMIAKAKLAIETFKNLPAPTLGNTGSATTTSNSTTTEVSLDKPRKVGDDAIKAVKSARDALKVVLKSIANTQPITSTSTQQTNN